MFKAYAINLQETDYQLIRRVVAIVTKEPVDVLDLRSYEIESTDNDVLFLFGRRAHTLGRDKKCKFKAELPEVEKLTKEYGTDEDRQETYDFLVKFKARLENKTTDQPTENRSETIKEDLITEPELAKTKIRELEYWEGKNKEGRLIRLSKEPETSTADINLTFQEFETLRGFMEVFGIKETKIVYKPSSHIRKNPAAKNK